MGQKLPRVVADGPLTDTIAGLLEGQVALLDWQVAVAGSDQPVDGVFCYGHPVVDGAVLDRLPGVRVISNHGVGVDHINVRDAADRGIPVGNTPGVLNGAVADMAMALVLAAGRRLVEGDRYARGPDYIEHDPGHMLGRDICGSTLGIVGMGGIGSEIARRANAFDMRVLYHNRRRRPEAEKPVGATYVSLDDLLTDSDYLVLCVPLNDETRGMIGRDQLAKLKPTASLVNIARGPIVDTVALTEILQKRRIYAAALDVTDPEPLPRDHPLLNLPNLTIMPHLGSATEQTRRRMAEVAVENLLLGLAGKPLRHEVQP